MQIESEDQINIGEIYYMIRFAITNDETEITFICGSEAMKIEKNLAWFKTINRNRKFCLTIDNGKIGIPNYFEIYDNEAEAKQKIREIFNL